MSARPARVDAKGNGEPAREAMRPRRAGLLEFLVLDDIRTEISELAIDATRRSLSASYLYGMDDALRAAIDNLVDRQAPSLSEDEQRRFSPYAEIFSRGASVDARHVALAAVVLTFEVALEAEGWRRAISAKSGEGLLFDALPELSELVDPKECLLPGDPLRFEVRRDAFVMRGLVVEPDGMMSVSMRRAVAEFAKARRNVWWRPSVGRPYPVSEYKEWLQKAIDRGIHFREDLIMERIWERHVLSVLRRSPPTTAAEEHWDSLEPVDRVEVLRTERVGKDGKPTGSFMFEELVPLSERHIDVGFVATTMFHCDTVLGSEKFSHVDVSILVYDLETYEQRLKKTLEAKIKAQGHLKLFWLEGASLAEWKQLLQVTYPRNELLEEYLTGRPVPRFPPPDPR